MMPLRLISLYESKIFFLVSITLTIFVSKAFAVPEVAFILPLSGSIADMGQAFRKGVELYQEQKQPKAIKFVFEDHQYDGKTTITAFEKLRVNNELKFVVVWGNTPSQAVTPVAESKKIPLIVVSYDPLEFGKKYVIAFGPKLETLTKGIATHFKEKNIKQPGALSIDIGDTLMTVERLNQLCDGKLVSNTISTDETDFKTQILGLSSKQVDGLLLLTLPGQGMTFLKQAKAMKFFPAIIGGDIFAQEVFQKEAKELNTSVSFVYTSVAESFIDQLQKRYNESSYFGESAMGYTLALFFDDLATKGEITLEQLKEAQLDKLSGHPLPEIRFVDSPEEGARFELGAKVYLAR